MGRHRVAAFASFADDALLAAVAVQVQDAWAGWCDLAVAAAVALRAHAHPCLADPLHHGSHECLACPFRSNGSCSGAHC